MKNNIRNISFIFLFLIFASCDRNDKLIGTWERHSDAWAGMKVKVVKEGKSFKAVIIHATDSNKLGGFVEGDIKWKNIEKTTEKKYEIESLGKTPVMFTETFEPSYSLANLELVSDNEVYIRKFSKGTEWIGTEQKWKRVIEE